MDRTKTYWDKNWEALPETDKTIISAGLSAMVRVLSLKDDPKISAVINVAKGKIRVRVRPIGNPG